MHPKTVEFFNEMIALNVNKKEDDGVIIVTEADVYTRNEKGEYKRDFENKKCAVFTATRSEMELIEKLNDIMYKIYLDRMYNNEPIPYEDEICVYNFIEGLSIKYDCRFFESFDVDKYFTKLPKTQEKLFKDFGYKRNDRDSSIHVSAEDLSKFRKILDNIKESLGATTKYESKPGRFDFLGYSSNLEQFYYFDYVYYSDVLLKPLQTFVNTEPVEKFSMNPKTMDLLERVIHGNTCKKTEDEDGIVVVEKESKGCIVFTASRSELEAIDDLESKICAVINDKSISEKEKNCVLQELKISDKYDCRFFESFDIEKYFPDATNLNEDTPFYAHVSNEDLSKFREILDATEESSVKAKTGIYRGNICISCLNPIQRNMFLPIGFLHTIDEPLQTLVAEENAGFAPV